jgi:hypothetical protein
MKVRVSSAARHHGNVPLSDSALEEVEFRAFRGGRRSAIYRSHVVPAAAVSRIVREASRERLHLLPQLQTDRSTELEPAAARLLASELSELRARASLLDLDTDIIALAAVANWCARSRAKAWLRIGRR